MREGVAVAPIVHRLLQADIQSVSDLGDGRYELAVYLWNVGGDTPIYVMSPDMHAYVQVGKVWQEVPLEPADSSSSGVLKIDGKQTDPPSKWWTPLISSCGSCKGVG
jgi:hypothetical protein